MAEVNEAAMRFAYDKGRKARQRGIPLDGGNPYTGKGPYRQSWTQGWQDEDSDMQPGKDPNTGD